MTAPINNSTMKVTAAVGNSGTVGVGVGDACVMVNSVCVELWV